MSNAKKKEISMHHMRLNNKLIRETEIMLQKFFDENNLKVHPFIPSIKVKPLSVNNDFEIQVITSHDNQKIDSSVLFKIDKE